jgi:hypothetical protein
MTVIVLEDYNSGQQCQKVYNKNLAALFSGTTREATRILFARPNADQFLYHGLEAEGHEDGLAGHHSDPHQLVRRHQILET